MLRGHGPAVRRSAHLALVVGPGLVLLNNADHLLRRELPPHFWWKAATTLLVPFLVSLYSAVRSSDCGVRRPTDPGGGA